MSLVAISSLDNFECQCRRIATESKGFLMGASITIRTIGGLPERIVKNGGDMGRPNKWPKING